MPSGQGTASKLQSGVELSRGVESREQWGALLVPSRRSRWAGRSSAWNVPPWSTHIDTPAGGMFETGR